MTRLLLAATALAFTLAPAAHAGPPSTCLPRCVCDNVQCCYLVDQYYICLARTS